MRAWEFLNEGDRYRGLSLRHLNKMKLDQRARQDSFDRRAALVRVMYSNPQWELERIELEKARVELAQQKAELAKTQAQADKENQEAISSMAASGRKRRRNDQKTVTDMATRGLGRRKKK